MRKLFPIILTLFFTTTAFSQTNGKITGTIFFGDDNAVLHQATVKVVELKRQAVSNDVGVFEFANVPPGTYTLLAHQEGFADVTQKVEVRPNETVTADFKMKISGVKEEVTVSASGAEQSTFEAIATVDTLDSTQLTSRAAVGLGDVLQDVSGVAKRSSGPGTSRPVIRGFDGDRVKVATDGVSVGSLASQSGDHSEPVDVFSVERIEVVKGPATLLYGSNAIGGVVNAISGHDEGAHPGLRGFISGIGATNNDQASGGAGIEYGTKDLLFWGNISGQRTGDYKAGGDIGTVANTFTRNAAGSVGGGYFGKHAYFTTNFNYYQSRYGIPLDTREDEPEERSLRLWRNDVKFNFGYNAADLPITSFKFTVDLSNYRHQELEEDEVGTTFRNKVTSFRSMFEQRKTGILTGRFGFEGYRRDFSTVGLEMLIEGLVKQDSFAVFGLEELNFERAVIQLGGRVEHNSYDPVNPALTDRSFTGFSGAVGTRINLWKGGAFVANYSHGYRAPALEELYNHGPHDGTLAFEVGNEQLKPEVSNGIDISLRHQEGRIKAEANYYYYAFRNFVFLAPTGLTDEESGFPIAAYLQGNSRFTGTELSLDVKATDYLNFITGLDYVNAQLSDGTPLPRIAPLRGRFGLDVHYKDLSVRPEFIAVDAQDRVFTNETRTAGYGVFNISANYVIPGKHYANIFSLSADNLTDKLYYNHISFIKDISPEIGRSIKLSYTIRFY